MRGVEAKRFAVAGTVLALAFAPGAALANSGSDQYCDPFGGCGGTSDSSPTGGARAGKLTPREKAQIERILNSMRASQRQRAAAMAKVAAAAVSGESLASQMRSSHARLVLEAAGLSAFRRAIPGS